MRGVEVGGRGVGLWRGWVGSWLWVWICILVLVLGVDMHTGLGLERGAWGLGVT